MLVIFGIYAMFGLLFFFMLGSAGGDPDRCAIAAALWPLTIILIIWDIATTAMQNFDL